MRDDTFVEKPCLHETSREQQQCPKCCGTGWRFVPRGMTGAQFDALYAAVRMFRKDA